MIVQSKRRRRHGAEFKVKVLAACAEPGASVSAVALAHGLNANLVHKWRRGRGLRGAASTTPMAARVRPPVLAAGAGFVPIELNPGGQALRAGVSQPGAAAATSAALVDIELRHGAASLCVRWPVSAAGDCAAWLREVAVGMLK